MKEYRKEVEAFLEGWSESDEGNKKGFEQLYALLESLEKGEVGFYPRPGVTYSLRGEYQKGDEQALYVMVDVIEDDPRWLSVCFYGEMINDPEEKGAFVPGGLLGRDAVCLDLEQYDESEFAYVEARIREAYTAATGG